MFNLRLLLVALVWGINFSVVKFALADFRPLEFTVIRFSFAALALFFVLQLRHESLALARKDRLPIVCLGFLGITLYNIFFMYGLQYTTAANSALLISLSPLFGALIQAFRGAERLGVRVIAGLGLASFGVYLIIRSHHDIPNFSNREIIGDILTLCAALTWALYTIAAKPLLEKYSPVKITAYSMAAGSIMLLPLSLPDLIDQRWPAVSMLSWSAAAFAALIAGVVAYVLWYEGVKQLGVTRTMVYHYLMPFAAVLFASLILGERMTALQIVGAGAVLLGVYFVQSSSNRTAIQAPQGTDG